MSNKNPPESTNVKIQEDGEVEELYLATNPAGDFVVEFVLLSCESSESSESRLWKCKFRMYNVNKLEKDDYSNLKANKALSYRYLSEINTPNELVEFTKEQFNLIKSKDKLSWSVAVSDEFYEDKSHKSTVRLLAISYKYSIDDILTLNNYGGKVKLFSKHKDNKVTYIGLSESPTTYEVMNGSSVVYNMTEETPENLFSNPFNAIISAYDWDTIALSTWGFWPLAIISVLGNIVFIVILQNVIISFMSAAFESAEKDGKKAVLNFQSRLINEYAHLEYSAFTSGRTWSDESKDWKSTPIYSNAESQIPTETECKFYIENDLEFIWTLAKKDEGKTTDNDVKR
ncbi:120_t:CDS:2 [Gigaspora margarita]|uniref:120_t:CDS:1 n=1 Tax=Gigaspora margarita TaxID=4874 RepID=A0ABN7VVF2_GIGMA|nr:120_t:CDS:2 [Gigaspora margarita]